MAVHQTEEREGKLRTVLKLEPGERVAICVASGPKTFPSATARTKLSLTQRRVPPLLRL